MALGSIGKLLIEIGIDASGVKKGTKETENEVSGLKENIQKHGKAIGAAFSAVGVSMIAMSDSAKKTNAVLAQTSLATGNSTAELRDLALQTTNVTFPLSEVTTTFDMLSKAGLTSKEDLQTVATAFDTLGDATGMSASQITSIMIPAFNAFNIPLQDASQYTDIFTHLTRNTTVSMSDFSSMLKYVAPDLDTLGLSMQDSVAVMEALADKGIQGSAATREFRTAVSQAKGDTSKFYEALGISQTELDGYKAKLDSAKGMTDKYAAAADSQFGVMDNLNQTIDTMTLKYGSMLSPLGSVMNSISALGPIIMVATSIEWANVAASWAMIAPYLAVIAPIVAVIAILYLLEDRFGVVSSAIDMFKSAGETLISWISSALSSGIDLAKSIIDSLGDKLLFILGPIGAVVYAFKHWDEIKTTVSNAINSILNVLSGSVSSFYDAGKGFISALIDGISSMISSAVSTVSNAVSQITSYLPFSDAKKGPLSHLTESGKALMETFAEGASKASGSATNTIQQQLPTVGISNASGVGVSGVSNSYAGDTINIGPVTLASSYDFDQLMKDITDYQNQKKIQKGTWP